MWEETVRFYWRVNGLSYGEVWLKLTANDIEAAANHLRSAGVVRRDEIEPLPESFQGFWIASPASIIRLISKPGE
ncbi:MAG: hypothetical protein L0Z68_06915 [Gammaproteobacteria bacterium]|nr:hypothetical protein [Gammaproteobacteria bacterium]